MPLRVYCPTGGMAQALYGAVGSAAKFHLNKNAEFCYFGNGIGRGNSVLVRYDTDDNPPHRRHPWIDAVSGPNARYRNFVRNPELVSEVLEDFRPFAHYKAVQCFYDLLRWLNGEESPFETNDCGLCPPRIDPNAPNIIGYVFNRDPVVLHGRLTILYRSLELNTLIPYVQWLATNIHDALRDRVPNFPAAVFVGTWPHLFTAIDRTGNVVSLRFWAWGADEIMAMQNLGGIFENLEGLFQALGSSLERTP